MKFPSYPKYKDSGVEWLGEVPEHWSVAELRRFIRFITSGSRGWAEYYADEGDIFIRIGNLTRDSIRIDLADVQRVNPPHGAEGERTRVELGDVLFSITAYLGSVAVAGQNVVGGYINQHVALVRLNIAKLQPEYAAYSTLADFGQAQLSGQGYGGTKLQLALDDVKSLWLPLPPLPEQHAIAAFLDDQTAKIDTLIARKRELIDKLKEKRAALITRTVTRGLPPEAAKAAGLDPNPRMKDSGVEWLGEVPEHWGVMAFRRHIQKIEQGWSPQAELGQVDDGCWGVLKLSAVKAGKYNPDECKGLPEDTDIPLGLEVRVGDLLITRANTPELVGDICVVNSTPRLRMLCDLIYRVRINKSALYSEFIKLFMLSRCGRSQITMDARGSSGSMVKLSQGHIKAWVIPVPPLSEQRSIAEYLDHETAKLDQMTTKVESAIERLQEYRSALITAAVTGKIDVREATQ